MDTPVFPFPGACEPPGAAGLVLLDAARAWRRFPGCIDPFPNVVVRRLAAVGLLGALAPIDSLMAVISVRARDPLSIGAPGDPVCGPDARLLAWIFTMAVTDGVVDEAALDRLALRVSIGSRALLAAMLTRLARAVRPRVTRGVLPASMSMIDHDDPGEPVLMTQLAAE